MPVVMNYGEAVTISDRKNGATARDMGEWKPLDAKKYLSSANRRAPVEDAPSLIGGKLYPPVEKKDEK